MKGRTPAGAIDSWRFLDFVSRTIIRAWVEREVRERPPVPWTPMTKPLAGADVHPPIARHLALRPWLLRRLYTGEVPEEV